MGMRLDYMFCNEYGCMYVIGSFNDNGCISAVEYDNGYMFSNNAVDVFMFVVVFNILWLYGCFISVSLKDRKKNRKWDDKNQNRRHM